MGARALTGAALSALLVIVAVLGLSACSGNDLAPRDATVPCYLSHGGGQLNLGSGCTLAIASGSTLSGRVAPSTGYGGVGAWATSAPIAAVTGTAIAPLGPLQPVAIATAGTVPVTIPAAGQIVCVWNTGSQTLTIVDTGDQVLAGNAALGQYDTLCFVSDGTRLMQIAKTDN